MNTILFKVNGNRIRRTNGFEPTSGEKNYSQLKFIFDEEWEGVPAVSVLQFFDESDIPEPIVKEITDNAVVVPVNEKLRGKEGILHIGVAGAKADGTTMDTRIIHVPVGEGFKLCGNESTLMYLNLLAYVARLLDATITEDNPLTSERLAKGSVREEHIEAGAVKANKLGQYAVTAEAIAFDAVETNKIKDGAVTSKKLASASVDYYHLKAGAVKTDSLDKKSVTGEKIADNSIGENHLSENSVTPNALDRMYAEFLGIPFIKSYAELNGYLTDAEDHQAKYCFYRFGFDEMFPKYGLLGDDIYMGYIAGLIGEQNEPELILTNTRTFEKWRYIRNSAKFEQVFLSTDVLDKKSVTEEKIADGSVTSEKLADKSVDYYHLKLGAVNPEALDRTYLRFNNMGSVPGSSFHYFLLQNADELAEPYMKMHMFVSRGDDVFLTSGTGRCIGFYVSSRWFQFKNLNTGKTYNVKFTEDEITDFEEAECTADHTIDNHISEVNEKGGMVTLTDPQLDALDNLFDLTAYTSDKSKDAYEAFVKAFGLDNYRVQREFTIDELFPCGLSYLREANITGAVMSEYGYYTKKSTASAPRCSYIYFDIPCKYGYTYKFDFETTQSTDNIAIELYNEYALNQVEAEGDYRSADHKEYNWIGNGGEITPPELINGYAPAGLRFVFNTGTPAVTKIKISKKRVL